MRSSLFLAFIFLIGIGTLAAQSGQYVRPDAEKRFEHFVKDTVGPYAWAGIVAGAGIGTATGSPDGWKKNGKGLGKRVASNFGRSLIRNSVTYGLDEALKLDSRYYKSEKETVGSRVGNALLSTVTARRPNGNRTVGIPRIVGTYTANIIAAETWYPRGSDWKDGVRNGSISLGVNAMINLVREFVSK
jgi:hypothetical protein